MSERFDAREIFRALADHEVEYVTIGGVAVQAHGGQRMTQDLDVLIASTRKNIGRLAETLRVLDGRILGPEGQRSSKTPSEAMLGSSEQLHVVTTHGRLDIVTLPPGFGEFDEVLARAHRVEMGEITVPIVSREDLLALKRAAGRPQDLADVRLLESLAPE